MRRLLHAVLLLPLAVTATGCGSGDSTARSASLPAVQLKLTAPLDAGTTRLATVQVSGTVRPRAARVLVLGKRVAVAAGRFSTTVDVEEGTNVIDVGASAPGARATWRALRVTRRSKIAVPQLTGLTLLDAQSRLDDAGLKAQAVDGGSLFDAFRGGPRRVCRTDPDAGAELDPGGEVTLVVARRC